MTTTQVEGVDAQLWADARSVAQRAEVEALEAGREWPEGTTDQMAAVEYQRLANARATSSRTPTSSESSAEQRPAGDLRPLGLRWSYDEMARRYGVTFTDLVTSEEQWESMTREEWLALTEPKEPPTGVRCATCLDGGVLQVNPAAVAPTRIAGGSNTRSIAWCPDCPAEIQRARQLDGSMSPAEWREFTFGSFRPTTPSLRNAYAIALAWAAGEDERPFLLISGDYGVGKTHLAVAVAHRLIETGHAVSYFTSVAFLDALRASFGDPEHPASTVRNLVLSPARVAILDDYGAEYETGWAVKELEGILAARYAGRRRTVVTTNLTIEEIGQRPAADLGRLASRLSDAREVAYVRVQGEDFRRKRERAS